MPNTSAPTIFVSYAHADISTARELVGDLVFMGFDVWYDPIITAGEGFRDKIMEKLRQADAVVGIWTNSSVQSKWVRQECDDALRNNKLVQTRVDQCSVYDVPIGFREEHIVLVRDTEAIGRGLEQLGLRPTDGITEQMIQLIDKELEVLFALWDADADLEKSGLLDKIQDDSAQTIMYANYNAVKQAIEKLLDEKKKNKDTTLRFPGGTKLLLDILAHYFRVRKDGISWRVNFLDWKVLEARNGIRFSRG